MSREALSARLLGVCDRGRATAIVADEARGSAATAAAATAWRAGSRADRAGDGEAAAAAAAAAAARWHCWRRGFIVLQAGREGHVGQCGALLEDAAEEQHRAGDHRTAEGRRNARLGFGRWWLGISDHLHESERGIE